MPLRCALSVDLDEIHHYFGIHGLHEPGAASAHRVYDVAVERCLSFARELGVPLTFFVVSSDLERPENVERLRAAIAAGHEIGSHSRDHFYDLVERTPEIQREQVAGALEDFERHLAIRPVGFRAPGYTVTDALLRIVADAGYLYDSSVFPCPSYYAAKAAALALLSVRGRTSRSVLDSPRVLTAPTSPYRIGNPYTARGSGLWELPIQVTRGPRLPFIGTALTMAGSWGARALTELVVGEEFINLELHGIDWLDASDGLGDLVGFQPDVRISAANKRRTLTSVVERLRRAGYQFVRVAEAVEGGRASSG